MKRVLVKQTTPNPPSSGLSGLSGDVSGLCGNAAGLSGNIDLADITDEERVIGVAITDLIQSVPQYPNMLKTSGR